MAKRLRTKDEPNTNVIFNKDREPIVDSEKVEEIWTEYFDELLNVVDDEEYMEEDNPQMEDREQDDMEPIHGEEVKQAIRALKNGKSPVVDGLNNEIFKTGEEMVAWMTELINCMWREENIPSDWRKAVVCPMHKKGDRRECQNYKGIVLLLSAYKIYELSLIHISEPTRLLSISYA